MEEKPEELAKQRSYRRAVPRYKVDEDAALLLVDQDTRIPCRVIELSLDGGRLQTTEPFKVGLHARVEVLFKVNGIAFRLSGAAQWTGDQNMVGISFQFHSPRRREELSEVLDEVEAAEAAKAQRRAAQQLHSPQAGSQAKLTLVPRDRRSHSRFGVNTAAVVHLVRLGTALRGRILDLSVGGCCIRIGEAITTRIFTRVETEFHLEGLPFRLAGVIQEIRDQQFMGIRFLDVSDRKQEQLQQLIEDLAAMKQLAKPQDSGA